MSVFKRKRPHANHERWLVSYADFITLLFAFFVVLYASSQADKHKMTRLAEAIESAFSKLGAMPGQTPASQRGRFPAQSTSAPSPAANELVQLATLPQASVSHAGQDLSELRKALERALTHEIQNHSVAVHQGPEGLVISLREMGFYSSGSAEVRTDAQPALTRIVDLLRDRPCHIRVEGHTDNVPIHTREFDSNWELSTARATSMIRQLVTVYQIAPDRLSAAGYGEFHPIASNATEEGRRSNRRIDIVILSSQPPASDSPPGARSAHEDVATTPRQ